MVKTFRAHAVLGLLIGVGALFASAQMAHQPANKDNGVGEEARRLNTEEVEALAML